ncbi:uncharacterized protein LOC105166397 [Sesamum indicum]|uniref:Uncharacterized protein LOC105166397 n=1 Tax=Sesamum indicum TaxID=4182 RepID=A0A6I9TGE2_SESIN|nr:uncharacterized protein LOC105166397 [Sesamum indicum]
MVRGRVVRGGRTRRNRETSNRMEKDPSLVTARFFKIMFGTDYSNVLYLPPKFARTVKHLAGQEIQIEDSTGLRWSVTLSHVNGSLAFQKGWPKFFLDHGLKEGEFVVFNYVKGSHFVVQIYGKRACERINFNNGTCRPNKRSRRGTETVYQDAPIQTTYLNSRDKPSSATSVASGSEFQTRQTRKLGAKSDHGRLQVLPIPIKMEDPACMVNRDDGHYLGEDRNFLYDLSLFEMERETDDRNKFEKALDTITIPSPPEVTEEANKFEKALGTMNAPSEIPEQANMERDDTQMAVIQTNENNGHSADIPSDKFEEALNIKVAPSHTDTVEQSKTKVDNSEMAVAHKIQVDGHSGEISTDKLEKTLDNKLALSRTEITEQTKIKGDDTQMREVHSEQIDDRTADIFTAKRHSKPSDFSNLKKDISGDASNFQNGNSHLVASDSESPSICSSKIAGREVKHRCYGSAVSSSVLKDRFGKHAIKKERVELGEEANGLPEVFGTEEPNMVREYAKMFPPAVKVEPDLYDTSQLVTVCAFSTEVKSLCYLELPIPIPSVRGRRDRARGKVVYLRDSSGRLWPVLYPDPSPVKALTVNWRNFCEQNDIKLGDKCRFQVEDIMLCIYKVDVIN